MESWCDSIAEGLADHLGSTSVVADTSGIPSNEVRYMPWGEDRYNYGTLPTSFKFTGQREEASLGLYFYGARWYDAGLGRFISADTIVPNPEDPVAWDRYAYVRNNPLVYIDPSGHRYDEDPGCYFCRGHGTKNSTPSDPWKVPSWFTLEPELWPAYNHTTAEDLFLAGMQHPIHGLTGNDPHGIGDKRGDDYCIKGDCAGTPPYHPGIDQGLEADLGTPIYSVGPGTVVYAGYSTDYGYVVVVAHDVFGHTFYSIYAHLGNGNADDGGASGVTVKLGDVVDSTTQIGTMGNTKGREIIDTHLHFEVRKAVNVNITPEGVNFSGKQWWIFKNGPVGKYRTCADWHSCWVDLGSIYGYDDAFPEEFR